MPEIQEEAFAALEQLSSFPEVQRGILDALTALMGGTRTDWYPSFSDVQSEILTDAFAALVEAGRPLTKGAWLTAYMLNDESGQAVGNFIFGSEALMHYELVRCAEVRPDDSQPYWVYKPVDANS